MRKKGCEYKSSCSEDEDSGSDDMFWGTNNIGDGCLGQGASAQQS